MAQASSDDARLTGRIAEIVAGFADLEGPLLPILHAVQHEFGCVPEAAQVQIARALNIGKAQVHGVTSFYSDFRREPAGRHVVKLCRSEACQSEGSEALREAVMARLGIGWEETTPDGAVTLEPVYCLGLCACGPSAMVDGELIGRADADMVLERAGVKA